jgi:hypothetical protein
MTLLACLLSAALLAPQDETVRFGNVLVRVPAGWKSEVKSDSLYLTPGDLKEGQDYVVIIGEGGKSDSNLAEVFEKSWKEFEKGGKVGKRAPGRETKTESGADGLFSVGIVDSQDARLIIGMAVFKAGDRYESVMALSIQDPTFVKYSGEYAALLKGLRFRNTEIQVAYDLLVSSDGKSLVVLFKDGPATSTLPAEGLDGIDIPTARKRNEASWGTHETKDGIVKITIGDKTTSLKPQADGAWSSGDNLGFVRAATSTGVKLDGRYAIGKPDTSSLLFKPDGTFEDQGGGAAYINPAEARLNPPKTGTYEIANNTLKLTYKGFTPKLVAFVALPSPEGALLINGTVFTRVP